VARQDAHIVGVVNSTPLIALATVGHLSLLRDLFDEVLVPTSVYDEVVGRGQGRPGAEAVGDANWLTVREPEIASPFPAELMGLDRGEVDVILLAREVAADWALIDERLARRIAVAMGLPVKGTLGVLLVGYRLGLLSRQAASDAVDLLAQSSVRLSERLVTWFRGQLT